MKCKILLLNYFIIGIATAFIVGCEHKTETSSTAPIAAISPVIDDGIITTMIKSGILADPAMKGFDSNIDTQHGVVTINGIADSQTQVDRVTEIARSVEGVKSIENKMTIKK